MKRNIDVKRIRLFSTVLHAELRPHSTISADPACVMPEARMEASVVHEAGIHTRFK
jgi:hypothetical protein